MYYNYPPKSFQQINRCYKMIIPDLLEICGEIRAVDSEAPLCFNLYEPAEKYIIPTIQMRPPKRFVHFTAEINTPYPRPVRLDDPRNKNISIVVGKIDICPNTGVEIFTSTDGKTKFRNTSIKLIS